MQATSGEGSRPPTRPAPAPSEPATATSIQEPAVLGELYAVSPAAGGLTALERVQMQEQKVRPKEYSYYFEGTSSPVTVRAGEPIVFAIRLLGPADRSGIAATPEEAQRHFLVTKLAVEEGRRYITRVDVQFDVRSYGTPTPGLDPKRRDRVAVSLALTPRVPLDPGEYVVYLAGIRNFAFIGNLKTGSDRWAFAVVNR